MIVEYGLLIRFYNSDASGVDITGHLNRNPFFFEQAVWFEEVSWVLGHWYQLKWEILKKSRL
ncbi:hypothetical protein [Microcoleus sp. D2_18a_D3]|uniref:hypothetical protein n=1 Tax=Microcoleus sp. D2_18a_D3 TaxID=3055330 RepID=UPI002FD699BE